MAEPTVRTDFDKAANVALHFALKVAFNLEVAIENFAQTANFRFAKIPNPLSRVHIGLRAQIENVVLADAIDERERILRRLVPRKVDTCDTCHKFLLFGLGIGCSD